MIDLIGGIECVGRKLVEEVLATKKAGREWTDGKKCVAVGAGYKAPCYGEVKEFCSWT